MERTKIELELKGVSSYMFKNSNVFDERYEPDIVYFRDDELKEILYFFNHCHQRKGNLDIVGPTGTGKTLTIQKVLSKYSDAIDGKTMRGIYINCKETNTCSKLSVQLAECLSGDKVGFHHALNIFYREARKLVSLVIILDEIDILLERDDDRILYLLANKPNISIVNISNNLQWRRLITDQRVISRMPSNPLVFGSYTEDELTAILSDRAKEGLHNDRYSREILDEIVQRTDTRDVRTALYMLKRAAEHAELKGRDKILIKDIIYAEERVKDIDTMLEFIRSLPASKILILLIIYDSWKNRRIYPMAEEIHRKYNIQTGKTKKLRPINIESLRVYLSELMTYNLISPVSKVSKRGKGVNPQTYRIDVDESVFEKEVYTPCWIK